MSLVLPNLHLASAAALLGFSVQRKAPFLLCGSVAGCRTNRLLWGETPNSSCDIDVQA